MARNVRVSAGTLAVLLFLSCSSELLAADPVTSSTNDPEFIQQREEFFEKEIRPLFVAHCHECHSSETGPDNGELVLDSLDGIREGGSRGPVIDPGKPDASLLLQALEYNDVDLQMPPEGKLPEADIARVRSWIEQGGVVPNTSGPSRPRTTQIDFSAWRDFWSFRPLEHPDIPSTAGANSSRRPLDRFIAARVVEAGLEPSPAADRRTLIRRATFDLCGVPPTPEEIDAFLTDRRPDAYEQLIDRLLASPRYGERWGRVWLDLARYTDTTASWLPKTGQAWLYRDWVVDAFNEGRPYDEFVRMQLAADLYPDTDPKDLAALGYLGLSPAYWKELRLAPNVIEQIVADEWDERIDAVSRTFLGLTVACARCHDHKFDPISMEDYYGLAGVFASTQFDSAPLLPEGRIAQVKKAQREIAQLEGKLKGLKGDEAEAIRKQIESIRAANPDVNLPQAPTVREASIYVLPEGEDRTRLEYRDGKPRDLPIFRRGNPSNPTQETVPRRFLTVLTESEPAPFEQGSGRAELAEQLFEHASGLVARVIVNRIWAQHFGRGLVRTPSNFGAQGERPTHPELLEYLAAELIAHDWDLKWLHREILLSHTYRQSSAGHADGNAIDPSNRLLWRMHRRRLDVEMWRDAMLAVTGTLDEQIGGAARPLDLNHRRRTLYAKIDRRDLDQMLRLHDFPEATSHAPQRVATTTPLQQLFVLNGEFVRQCARQLAGRVAAEPDDSARIVACYRLLYGRDPTTAEIELGKRFLAGDATSSAVRWKMYAQVLLAANEFQFVD